MDRNELKKRLVDAGLRATQQRLAILGLLARRRGHFSAERLVDMANCSDSSACRASVYNALRSLVEVGLVRELNVKQGATLYEFARDPHHHFLCGKCGDIFDLHEQAEVRVSLPESLVASVSRIDVTVHGDCPQCSTCNPSAVAS